MDTSELQLFPVLSPILWDKTVARFSCAAPTYLKKLGIHDRSLPNIENYFDIKTFSPPGISPGIQNLVDFVPREQFPPDSHFSHIFDERCPKCNGPTVEDVSSSQVCCKTCGESRQVVFHVSGMGAAPSMGTVLAPKRLTAYMYKRTNHFLDHLKRVQAKESTTIREEILLAVESELRKERIDTGDVRITTTKVRGILKKLRLQKYYNHVFAITARLSGRSPPTLTPLQEEKLLSMFQQIQDPFERNCPPDRTNMLSYSYCLFKMSQLLGWHDLAQFFPLLKSRVKIHTQDNIWKKICADLGWPFIRSIA